VGQHDDEHASISSDVAALRAWAAFRQGAFTAAISRFRKALVHLSAQAHFQRGMHLLFLHHTLTLVSAPAGFGKTTAVSDWLHARGVPNRLQARVGLF
jgi:ATP/maltotriose-dependent transcriptional regulator MalT